MTGTLVIALWGATLGTVTLAWNLWKWRQESPRVVASVEAIESFTREDGYAGIRFKIRNRGGKKTTIEQVLLYRRHGWLEDGWAGIWFRLSRTLPWQRNLAGSDSKTVKLPAVLDTGGLWEGWAVLEDDAEAGDGAQRHQGVIPDEDIHKLIRAGELRYSVVCSHTSRPLRGLVLLERDSLRE
jgi:hypothetical protein